MFQLDIGIDLVDFLVSVTQDGACLSRGILLNRLNIHNIITDGGQ